MATITKVKNPTLANAIDIVRYAITNKTSINEACLNFGFGSNYVSDVKYRLQDRINSKTITKTEAKLFTSEYKKYLNQ
jgi:hypothetical protein